LKWKETSKQKHTLQYERKDEVSSHAIDNTARFRDWLLELANREVMVAMWQAELKSVMFDMGEK